MGCDFSAGTFQPTGTALAGKRRYVIRTIRSWIRDYAGRTYLWGTPDARAATMDWGWGYRLVRHRNSFRGEGYAAERSFLIAGSRIVLTHAAC